MQSIVRIARASDEWTAYWKWTNSLHFRIQDGRNSRGGFTAIAEKGYARSYLTDNRKIVCIGVNFSSLTRTVEEWKEIIYR